MVDVAHLHLADLVLAGLFCQLLLQGIVRLVDLEQLLLHLAEQLLESGRTCGACCIQLLCGQKRQAAQLVSSTGCMSPERRCSKLQSKSE